MANQPPFGPFAILPRCSSPTADARSLARSLAVARARCTLSFLHPSTLTSLPLTFSNLSLGTLLLLQLTFSFLLSLFALLLLLRALSHSKCAKEATLHVPSKVGSTPRLAVLINVFCCLYLIVGEWVLNVDQQRGEGSTGWSVEKGNYQWV